MKKQNGFSKIEILIVVGIVGLLGIISIVLLNNSQQKTRDAKRLSDISRMQAGLEMYYTQGNGFSGACLEEGEGSAIKISSCQSNQFIDWKQYMDPRFSDRGICNSETPDAKCSCSYSIEITNAEEYYIFFCLEKGTDQISKGLHFVSRNGIDR